MQNRSAILSCLLVGVVLISAAIFLVWQFGNQPVSNITSFACVIGGSICVTLSGIGFLRNGRKEDYFNVE